MREIQAVFVFSLSRWAGACFGGVSAVSMGFEPLVACPGNAVNIFRVICAESKRERQRASRSSNYVLTFFMSDFARHSVKVRLFFLTGSAKGCIFFEDRLFDG